MPFFASLPTLGLSLTLASASPSPAGVDVELDDASLDRWLAYVRPSAPEPWRALPWHSTLLGGVEAARDAGRPVLFWAMSGHPLGST